MPSKKCNKNQIENPKTKRCVSKKGKIGKELTSVSCPAGKILNPKTGRCVSKTGALGKAIANGGCSPKKILNPKTKRCVDRSGSIGKKLKGSPKASPKKAKASPKKAKASPKKVPRGGLPRLEAARGALTDRVRAGIVSKQLSYSLSEKCKLTELNLPPTKDERRRALLGRGAEGSVYRVTDDNGSEYVLKVSEEIDANFKVEAAISKRLSDEKFKHAPIVVDAWKCKGYGYILMEGLKPLGRDKQKNKQDVRAALDILHKFNIVYPDAHDGNFMRRADGTLVVIDYGWAYHFPTRDARVKNRHRDTYRRASFTWDMVLAWEAVIFAEAFGTAADYRAAGAEFDRAW
jgi:hypothetical protein